MKKDKTLIITAIIVVALLIIAYFVMGGMDGSDNDTSGDGSSEHSLSPDFTVTDMDGNEVSLSGLRGEPVIVSFWASWSESCVDGMDIFEEAYARYGEEVRFMMINMTDGEEETVDSAKKYINDNGYTFPVYFDEEFSAAGAYFVLHIPATYFIDADGYVIAEAEGLLDESVIRQGVELMAVGE